MLEKTLRITEIFYSLQGETTFTGLPTVFIRLTGCPLRCGYCDSEYAFKGGKTFSLSDILQEVKKYGATLVTVTGGEPLAQPACIDLLQLLIEQGHRVSLETSGAINVSKVPVEVTKILDIKTPGSKEVEKNHWQNLELLNIKDEIKFVICDQADFNWAVDVCNKYDLFNRFEVLFSPSFNQITLKDLAELLLQAKVRARLQIQLHKYIWGDKPGH